MPIPSSRPLTELQGQIERITYTNGENAFTIARLKVAGRHDLVTVAGNIASPTAGAVLRLRGQWSHHPVYGEQFKAETCEVMVPATTRGIEKYLGSGLIQGIGPVMAKRIVKRFGADALTVIDASPEQLTTVPGIGEKRVALIRTAWVEQKQIREVMLFLQGHDVSAAYATKIFKQYGRHALAVVTENPYRMAMDISGIGFVTADRIARKIGFDPASPLRTQAGILYVLHQLAEDGHTFFPLDGLVIKCQEMLAVADTLIRRALDTLVTDSRIVVEPFPETPEISRGVFLSHFHTCETGIARRLCRLLKTPQALRPVNAAKAIEWLEGHLPFSLATKQREAIGATLGNKVLVITGGPGTGKTTIIDGILRIFSRMGARIDLAAPTGRAAKRMDAATGREAKTIHRLLSYSFRKGGFQKNERTPLDCDVLIVDEASMIDTVLMHHLIKAVPAQATLVLVGDVSQLPSVGAGNVLRDIIRSQAVPVVTLDEIFRQARASRIVVNAHRINEGKMPETGRHSRHSDFYFITQSDPEAVRDTIVDLVCRRIPAWRRYDPVEDIQVLTPMHRGVVGAASLNLALQEALNPDGAGIDRGNRTLRVGDKVMQVRNNYEKEVYNGDLGRILQVDSEHQTVTAGFDGRTVTYACADLDELMPAYAVSVHKAQGSEYPVVVLPVVVQHYMLLQRNLIYTAVTRGRRLVVMVGTRKALAIGVKNNHTVQRHTRLAQRLAGSGTPDLPLTATAIPGHNAAQ